VEVITSKLDGSPVSEVMGKFVVHRCPSLGVFWGSNPATLIVHKLLKSEADVIHAHSYVFLTTNQAALTRKLRRIPLLLHLHGGIEVVPFHGDVLTRLKFTAVKSVYDRTIGKWTLSTADAIASVSKKDIEVAKKLFGIDGNLFHWVPNAVDVRIFKKDSVYPSDDLYVLFVGRLDHKKGIDVLLDVAKIVIRERNDVVFIIIGEGSLKEKIEVAARSLHGSLRVLGQIPSKTLPEWLSRAAILILPSYTEGLPTVCLEALATETPVVASNVGGTSEVIIDGKTGYLFPPGNVQLCAEKVLRLLADEALRRRMGRYGRDLVERFYSWEKVVEKIERLYESI